MFRTSKTIHLLVLLTIIESNVTKVVLDNVYEQQQIGNKKLGLLPTFLFLGKIWITTDKYELNRGSPKKRDPYQARNCER